MMEHATGQRKVEVDAVGEPPEYPGTDPGKRLSATGRRILAAARKLLAKRGYPGLSIDAIAKEAGENKSSVHYHFGGKDGLLASLADSVMYDDYLDEIRRAAQNRSQPVDEIAALIATSRTSTVDHESYVTFFELLPHMSRDAELRRRAQTVYAWYRDMDAWTLAPALEARLRDHLEPLAALTVAVADGLAMQRLVDPRLDIESAYDLWEAILRLVLDNLERLPFTEVDAGSGLG
jgi:AcrR family transcriptional regulator